MQVPLEDADFIETANWDEISQLADCLCPETPEQERAVEGLRNYLKTFSVIFSSSDHPHLVG